MRKKIHLFPIVPINLLILCLLLGAAFAGSKVVTVATENAPVAGRHCVVIDAGHGGVDGGAVSCTGVFESALNLEIALRLDDLMHLLGINTSMIRTTDISIHTEGESIAAKKVSDLKQRVGIANSTNNALLISIHQNYYSDSRYSGTQVFYANTQNSDTFAKKMQDLFISTINQGSKRQAKKATGVYLMQHIRCTGILVECGFLSNPQEESKLRSAEYQKRICCVIASAASLFLNSNDIA